MGYCCLFDNPACCQRKQSQWKPWLVSSFLSPIRRLRRFWEVNVKRKKLSFLLLSFSRHLTLTRGDSVIADPVAHVAYKKFSHRMAPKISSSCPSSPSFGLPSCHRALAQRDLYTLIHVARLPVVDANKTGDLPCLDTVSYWKKYTFVNQRVMIFGPVIPSYLQLP